MKTCCCRTSCSLEGTEGSGESDSDIERESLEASTPAMMDTGRASSVLELVPTDK